MSSTHEPQAIGDMVLERGVDAPHVQPVRQVQQQRQHADVHQDEAQQRRLHAEEAARVVALGGAQHGQAAQHHHAGDDAADKQVQRDLPAPGRQVRVDEGLCLVEVISSMAAAPQVR
jgi:hypothetical protein